MAGAKYKRLDSDDRKWEKYGYLKKIILYPIEGGHGIKVNDAQCTPYGLQSTYGNTIIEDRTTVLYNPKKCNEIITKHRDLAKCKSMTVLKLIREKADALDELNQEDVYHTPRTNTLRIHNLGSYIVIKLSKKFPDLSFLRLGYCTPQAKAEYNMQMRNILTNPLRKICKYPEFDGYCVNFSPYSLINTRHISRVEEAIENDSNITSVKKIYPDISHWNFHPNFLVEGHEGLLREEAVIKGVKIGDVEFNDIMQCTRPDSVNFNFRQNNESEFIYSHLATGASQPTNLINSQQPTFGINMQLVKPGKVFIYDNVFITFDEADN